MKEKIRHLKEIYKQLYLIAQTTMEALLENDMEKARQVKKSKSHYNGMIENARSHLYTRVKSGAPQQLSLYKIETSTLENFRRIHNLLRRICNLVIQAGKEKEKEKEKEKDKDAAPPDTEQPAA